MMENVMIRSGHVDSFARDNLPPQNQWPEFKFTLPELQYPERLNCVTEFLDRWVSGGEGGRIAIISPTETLTYAQLASMSRWKCIVPFGSPVVPDVNAIRQTSSLAVSQAVKLS